MRFRTSVCEILSAFIQELREFHQVLKSSLAATRNSDQIPVQIGSSRDVAFPEIFFSSSCSSFQTKKHFLRKNFVQSKYLFLFQESCLCSHSTLLCHQTSNPHCIRSCAETSYLQITISADKFTKSYLHLTENRCDKELKGCGEFRKQVGFKHR